MLILGILILAILAGLFGFIVVGPLAPVLYFLGLVLFLASAVMHIQDRKKRRRRQDRRVSNASLRPGAVAGIPKSDRESIECSAHGSAYVTYVCRHLIDRSNTHWYSGQVDEEHLWPDSWCGICHSFYEAEGEWNERSEAAAELGQNLKLLCHLCYQRIRATCITHTI